MKRVRQKYENGIPTGYLGTRDLQELLGKSTVTIWKMIKDGRLPKPLKDGKLNIWDRKQIMNLLEHAKFTR